jgi:hypothetical protein
MRKDNVAKLEAKWELFCNILGYNLDFENVCNYNYYDFA